MIATGGTFLPDEGGEELFDDKPLAVDAEKSVEKGKLCVFCEQPLTRPLARARAGAYIHQSCLVDGMESGYYSLAALQSYETENNLPKFFLQKNHPSVRSCVLCGGSWGSDEQVGKTLAIYNHVGNLALAHTVCVANAVYRREVGAARLATIAQASGMNVSQLFPQSLQRCIHCQKPVDGNALLTHDGALVHEPCLSHMYRSGRLNELQMTETASLNHLSRETLGESPSTRFAKKAALGALIVEAQGFMAGIWNRFVGWVKGLLDNLGFISQSYDEATAQLEEVVSASGSQTTSALVDGLRLEFVRSQGSDDIVMVSTSGLGSEQRLEFIHMADKMHRFLGVRPSKVAAAGKAGAESWREVVVPHTLIRESVLLRLGITPEVEQAMQLVTAIEEAERSRSQKLQEIRQRFNVQGDLMKKAVPEAEKKILDYIKTLTNKQRKYQDTIFRVKIATRKTATSYKDFLTALKAAHAADEALTAEISRLMDQATTPSSTFEALETILPEVPSEVRQQLNEISVPAQSGEVAPASAVPVEAA